MQQTCTTCPRPVPDTAFGCSDDAAALARLLDELAAVLPELGVTVARQDRIGSGGARAAGAEIPLPYRDTAADKGRAIQGELVTWARHVNAESGRPIGGSTGSALARYLAQACDWARYRQEWPEYHAALRPLLGTVIHLIDRPADKVYLGPCNTEHPETGETCTADVLAAPGAGKGKCRECGAVHDVAESRAWLLEALKDVLARPVEIAGVLKGFGDAKVSYSTVSAYIAEGWVLQKGIDGHGRPRYRIGDVIEVRRLDQQRKHRREVLASQGSQS